MNRIVNFLQKYFAVISVLIGISILLSVTFSSYIVTSNNHKAAEMYIGELKYSIELNGSSTNTLSVPTGETIIDIKVNNLNPVDTYYKLLYLKNTNITVKYYESTKDTNDVVTTYNKPNDSITSSNSNTIKLLITNSSTSSQNIALTMKGGYITNTLEDIIIPSTYSEITLVETPSTNTYFCKTNDTLTQGLQYVNGQYTYAYKQRGNYASSGIAWNNINNNGWGVQLTDKASTNAVTSKLCTYINNKPITSVSYMFSNSQATTLDLSNFDTSKVTDMTSMFYRSQTELLNLSSLDTSNVTSMSGMFSDSQTTTLDVSGFNTSKVTNMSDMFAGTKVRTLNLSKFDTSKVTNMSGMFADTSLTSLNVSNFNTSKVTDMSCMFVGGKFTILDLSNFDTSNVTEMWRMFDGAQATKIVLSSFNTSNVTNMYQMFSKSHVNNLDLSNFNTSKVTDMNRMFWSTYATTIDVSSFDTSKVTDMNSMFYGGDNLETIYASSKFVTTAVSDSEVMFEGSTSLVGGAGTKYNSSYTDKTYARIDKSGTPGYFTDAASKPSQFSLDDWGTIVRNVKSGNTNMYKTGDTKEVNLGSTYGTHTLRIANISTPSECSTTGFSQTACGFVLEFADIITTRIMNSSSTNVGGWPASSMRRFVNNDIYNSLPSNLKNGIIDTTVVSSHGSSDSSNFTSIDKLYLLAPKEIYSDGYLSSDTAKYLTRQLDYYKKEGVTTSNYSKAIKMYNSTATIWWLRSAVSSGDRNFFTITTDGNWSGINAYTAFGVSPAFRIG